MRTLETNSSTSPAWPASALARKYECNACFDEGYVLIEGVGAKKCDCLKRKHKAQALARIPLRYREHTLATATADVARHWKQPALLAAMREDARLSLFLYGPSGTGKTHFAWMMYRQAVEEGRRAVGISLAELLLEYRVWEKDADTLPTIIPGNLLQSRPAQTPGVLILLDDVDKARPSLFAAEMLFRLVDAAYNNNHQLVVTSNLAPSALAAKWSEAGDAHGSAIVRRIQEIENGCEVDFFEPLPQKESR